MAALRALVTAGGTREPIDDVRVITNLSRGRFGAAIARALAAQGVETTVLGSREALSLFADDEPIARVGFGSYADLSAKLDELLERPPDLLFMAAAVSDYAPIPQAGKIRSDADELTIRLTKTAKLLPTLRERCGVGTFLVGFKLLSNVSRQQLVDVARRQVQGGRLNLTVANDLREFTEALHPVVLVTPEGGAIPIHDRREAVAERLVAFVLRRQAVTWSRSERLPGEPSPDAAHAGASALLAFAQESRLLGSSSDGNVTHRAAGARLWATPRQVDKSQVTADDLVAVDVNTQARAVAYQGAHKASIDSAVHGWLYERLPSLEALVHTHHGLILPDVTSAYPYPCGTLEEAEAIYAALMGAAKAPPFAVHLVHHGDLIGLEAGGTARVASEWAEAKAAYRAHLRELGEPEDSLSLAPILAGAQVVGVEARGEEPAFTSAFLLPSSRGRGLGERVLAALDARGDTVGVRDECGVLAFYAGRGYRVRERRGPLALLDPPSRRDDLIAAASVCLFDPVSARVLVGQRKRGAHVGVWSFPGGRVDPGETRLEAAVRELREETGLTPPTRTPDSCVELSVGSGDGAEAFSVSCFVFLGRETQQPRETPELAAEWVDLAEALSRRLSPGVRGILKDLANSRVRLPGRRNGPSCS